MNVGRRRNLHDSLKDAKWNARRMVFYVGCNRTSAGRRGKLVLNENGL